MKNYLRFSAVALFFVGATKLSAFCGFYVAQAGSQIFNNKSEVIIVRDGQKQTLTMLNDFKGNLKNFAMVVPVPVVLQRSDIRVMEQSLFASFDQYSAPRLVEYFDANPCGNDKEELVKSVEMQGFMPTVAMVTTAKRGDNKVTIEAQYSIDEYEIVILSAKESDGLEKWLKANGYEVPENAKEVLEPYIKDKLKFFAVKVNLNNAKQKNQTYLRPIQITFNSSKFMLPIRLGMANSNGEQDLVVYAFTRNGRVEAANYRTVEMPTAKKVPTFVKDNYASFYSDMFTKEYANQGKNAVFVEYAWNVSPIWAGVKCDPCVGNPPIVQDLLNAGVDWLSQSQNYAGSVFFTRLHVRYSREKFPEDLAFIETPNTLTYQVRQVISNPATGEFNCENGKAYYSDLKVRRKLELEEMQLLAGWNPQEYPDYIKQGSGEKKELEQDQQQNEERGHFLPLWLGGGGHPPGWLLPALVAFALLVVSLFSRIRYKLQ